MLIKKICLFLLWGLVSGNSLLSQNHEWIDSEFPGSVFLGIIEKDGKLFGAVSNGPLSSSQLAEKYELSIYEILIDEENNSILLLKVSTLTFDTQLATIAVDYIEETNLWLIAQSAYVDINRYLYRFALYDTDFNLVSERVLDTLGNPLSIIIDSDNTNTYLIGSLVTPPRNEVIFLNYNHAFPDSLPSIVVHQTDPTPTFLLTSMIKIPDSKDMALFSYDGISVIDTNLHQKSIHDYFEINTYLHGSITAKDDYFYSHGATRQEIFGLRSLAIQKYDSNFNVLKSDTLGILGQDNYPFFDKSITCKNGKVVIGGHLDGPASHLNFYNSIKKFYIAKFDLDLNELSYNEYGGDRAYSMVGVHTTEDDGTLAYGFITDTVSNERHAYLIFIDKNGDITSTNLSREEFNETNPFIVKYWDRIEVHNNYFSDVDLHVYSISGQKVAAIDIRNQMTELNFQELPDGIYYCVLIKENEIISSDSWFKIN